MIVQAHLYVWERNQERHVKPVMLPKVILDDPSAHKAWLVQNGYPVHRYFLRAKKTIPNGQIDRKVIARHMERLRKANPLPSPSMGILRSILEDK
jgi:hypothetical protein